MRVMLDTNVLIQILAFDSKYLDDMMKSIFENHKLVLSSYVVEEFKDVIARKFPKMTSVVDRLLSRLSYEYVYTPDEIDDSLFEIRDAKDYPVLYTAILEDVDILITNDKDFEDVGVEKPEILTPGEFVERYV